MCYNYSSTKKLKELSALWNIAFEQIDAADEWQPLYHAAAWNKPTMPVIVKEDGNYAIKLMEWTVAAPWERDAEKINKRLVWTANARRDKLIESPLWGKLLNNNQTCLVPGTGIFESHEFDKKKYPYYIHPKSDEIIYMPGIYAVNNHLEKPLITYAIITDMANPTMRQIHNSGKNPHRQVIWHKQDQQALNWLDTEISVREKVNNLSHYPDAEILHHTVPPDYKKNEFMYDARTIEQYQHPIIGLP